jgi:AAA ATPase domain
MADQPELMSGRLTPTQDFSGREWLEQEFASFLETGQGSYFLLTGERGIGKTAFAAQLIAKNACLYHFIDAQSLQQRNPQAFVHALSKQITSRFGADLVDAIRDLPQVNVTFNIAGEVRSGARLIGANIENFVNSPVEDEFLRLVVQPLETLAARGEGPVTLVIDGLDEAYGYPTPPGIHLLAAHLGRVNGLRLLLTSAPGRALTEARALLPTEQGRLFTLDGQSEQNLTDCRLYLERVLTNSDLEATIQAAGISRIDFIQAVLGFSEGNFLYITTLLEGIKNSGPEELKKVWQALEESQSALKLESFASKMAQLYRLSLVALVQNDIGIWQSVYAPLLGLLAVARQPLTESQLIAFSGLGGSSVHQALENLTGFLDFDGSLPASRRTYRLYHSAFTAFLLDPDLPGEFWLDAAEFHRKIADYHLARFPDLTLLEDAYALENLTHHLRGAGRDYTPRLFQSISPQVRAARRLRTQSDYLFSNDLAEAIEAALELGAPQGLPEIVRCGLVSATLVSSVKAAPPNLLRQLARSGQWQRARSLAQTGGEAGVEGLANVAHGLLDTGDPVNQQHAAAIAASLPSQDDEAYYTGRLWVRLGSLYSAQNLPDQAQQAFALARQSALQLPGADQRGRLLAELAFHEITQEAQSAKEDFALAIEAAREMPAELDEAARDYISNANMTAQKTSIEARWVQDQNVFDTLGAKARALADVAYWLARAGDGRRESIFAEAEELVNQIGSQGMELAFSEHTRDYISQRRSAAEAGAIIESAPPPISALEMESALQALEAPPLDRKGFQARALLALARTIVDQDAGRAGQILDRAEAASEQAQSGYLGRALMELAELRRKLGQTERAIELEKRAQSEATSGVNLPALYRAWLAELGQTAAASFREVASVRGAIFKGAYYSDRVLADMAASLAADNPEDALELANKINDLSQRGRALAAVAAYAPAEQAEPIVESILALRENVENFDFLILEALRALAPRRTDLARKLCVVLESPDMQVLGQVELASALDGNAATEAWQKAWDLAAQAPGGSVALANALARLGLYWRTRQDPRAVAAIERALQAARDEPSPPQRVEALIDVAEIMRPVFPAPARDVLEEATRLAPKLDGIRECGRALSDLAAAWMELDPSRAFQLLADLRRLGRGNFLDSITQAAPVIGRRWGADLAWQIFQSMQQAEAFFG